MPRHRRNPPLPAAPPKRRLAGHPSPQQLTSSLARVRKMSQQLDERDRPFSPERRGTWQGSSRDLVVNGRRMDEFTRGFLETALWSSNDDSDDSGGEPLDKNYSIDDFSPKSLKELIADCEQFQRENADDLAVAYEQGIRGSQGEDEFSAGHDFWLTRCGHGSGFWDGDYPEPQATRLTEAAEKFGNVDLTIEDGVIHADGHWNTGRLKRNGEQQHFPWGSKRAGALEITMPDDFDWEQVDGDVNLPTYGGIIGRCEDGQIDLVEIQPVREYVGDSEAADVGFPFWTKEASYVLEDLQPTNEEVKAALQSSDVNLDEIEPEHQALAIALACMRYGHGSEEGDGGWAGDKKPGEEGRANLLGSRKVRWGHSGVERKTFAEEASDEDDEFRREVLGTEVAYTYKMTYEVWDDESLEAGETDNKGWEDEGSREYDSLDDILNANIIKNKSWTEWSDTNPDGKRSWLISEEEDRGGQRTVYNLWIDRVDGEPKTQEEIDTINEKLGISTFGRMRGNRARR